MRPLLAAILTCSSLCLADFTVVNEAVGGGKTRLVTLSNRGTRTFMELTEGEQPPRTMLRDAATQKLYVVDHAKKTVTAMPEPDEAQVSAQQAALKAQLQAQLSRLPPEQRARIEATMLSNLPGEQKAPPVFTFEKKKGPARKVAGYTCQDYLVSKDGAPNGEGCFASWKDLGLSAGEFFEGMKKALPRAAVTGPMGQSFEAHTDAPGFPVSRTLLDAQGQPRLVTTLKSFSKKALAAEKFELPKDYEEKVVQLPVMPGAAPQPTK